MDKEQVTVTVNGRQYERSVEPRRLLSDFIREDIGLTGTHVGCEHGICGTCTVLMNGRTAVTKSAGSSDMVRSPTPRGWFRSR